MGNSDYTARISNANPLELVVITYELIDGHLENAITGKSVSAAKADVVKARKFLTELIVSLDMEIEISRELMSIYIYVNKLLIEGELKLNGKKASEAKKIFSEAREILNNLAEGWKTLLKDDKVAKGEKIMGNTQQVYAGLTYKAGKLEEFVDDDKDRGFKA